MERYKELSRQWALTKLLITCFVFVGAIIICVLGFVKDAFVEVCAAEIALFVIWFLLDKILDMLRPVPPIMMIPMPKEKKDESTNDYER